jgi:heptaprenyl diphosphate synthase
MRSGISVKKIAYLGLFLALALICSYIETLIPFHIGIPGVKLGLTNIVIVWALYLMGTKEALLISVLRIVLSGMMFGNAFSIAYSMAGGLLSFLAMFLLKKTNQFKCVTVSITGGIFHNIGQLCIAAVIVQNYSIFYYIPVLMVSGIITGLLIGIISQELIIRVRFQFQ